MADLNRNSEASVAFMFVASDSPFCTLIFVVVRGFIWAWVCECVDGAHPQGYMGDLSGVGAFSRAGG